MGSERTGESLWVEELFEFQTHEQGWPKSGVLETVVFEISESNLDDSRA